MPPPSGDGHLDAVSPSQRVAYLSAPGAGHASGGPHQAGGPGNGVGGLGRGREGVEVADQPPRGFGQRVFRRAEDGIAAGRVVVVQGKRAEIDELPLAAQSAPGPKRAVRVTERQRIVRGGRRARRTTHRLRRVGIADKDIMRLGPCA